MIEKDPYTLIGDDLQECLDCGYQGFDHMEIEIDGQDEAEVICPKCKSPNYYLFQVFSDTSMEDSK